MKGSLRGISKLSQRPAELGLLERLCAPRHELGLKFGRGEGVVSSAIFSPTGCPALAVVTFPPQFPSLGPAQWRLDDDWRQKEGESRSQGRTRRDATFHSKAAGMGNPC